MLAVLSTPYVAAVLMSLIWACAQLPERLMESITAPLADKESMKSE